MIALVTESAIFLQIMTINIIGNGSDLGCLICVSGWPRRGLINLFQIHLFFCRLTQCESCRSEYWRGQHGLGMYNCLVISVYRVGDERID